MNKWSRKVVGAIAGAVGLSGGVSLPHIKDLILSHEHPPHQHEQVVEVTDTSYDQALLDIKAHIDSRVLYTCTGETQ